MEVVRKNPLFTTCKKGVGVKNSARLLSVGSTRVFYVFRS